MEAASGTVEFGRFDMNRLPLRWDKMKQSDINDMQKKLEKTTEQQRKQLENRKSEVMNQ
jgi:hypothetical protein